MSKSPYSVDDQESDSESEDAIKCSRCDRYMRVCDESAHKDCENISKIITWLWDSEEDKPDDDQAQVPLPREVLITAGGLIVIHLGTTQNWRSDDDDTTEVLSELESEDVIPYYHDPNSEQDDVFFQDGCWDSDYYESEGEEEEDEYSEYDEDEYEEEEESDVDEDPEHNSRESVSKTCEQNETVIAIVYQKLYPKPSAPMME